MSARRLKMATAPATAAAKARKAASHSLARRSRPETAALPGGPEHGGEGRIPHSDKPCLLRIALVDDDERMQALARQAVEARAGGWVLDMYTSRGQVFQRLALA